MNLNVKRYQKSMYIFIASNKYNKNRYLLQSVEHPRSFSRWGRLSLTLYDVNDLIFCSETQICMTLTHHHEWGITSAFQCGLAYYSLVYVQQ